MKVASDIGPGGVSGKIPDLLRRDPMAIQMLIA